MSLERRKEPKETKKENQLENSSFRQTDFRPLQTKLEVPEEEELPEYIDMELLDELTEIEMDVLEIAKEILKLKRYDAEFEVDVESADHLQKYPIIEKLYAKSIAKLSFSKGYGKEEIFLAIRGLEAKNWIVTSERRTKLEILANEKFRNVLDFINSYPGIHARDDRVEKELNITRTPFLKYIMTLERFKLIRSKKIGKTLHYFIGDVPPDLDEYRVIFSNPMIPQVIEEFFKDETVSITRISEFLEVYSGTVQYHIKKLKDLNIVRVTKNQAGSKIHLVNIKLLKEYNKIFKEPDFTQLLKGL